jgi:hypothetical protein
MDITEPNPILGFSDHLLSQSSPSVHGLFAYLSSTLARRPASFLAVEFRENRGNNLFFLVKGFQASSTRLRELYRSHTDLPPVLVPGFVLIRKHQHRQAA